MMSKEAEALIGIAAVVVLTLVIVGLFLLQH